MLYQLSYFRISQEALEAIVSVGEDGFEPPKV